MYKDKTILKSFQQKVQKDEQTPHTKKCQVAYSLKISNILVLKEFQNKTLLHTFKPTKFNVNSQNSVLRGMCALAYYSGCYNHHSLLFGILIWRVVLNPRALKNRWHFLQLFHFISSMDLERGRIGLVHTGQRNCKSNVYPDAIQCEMRGTERDVCIEANVF